MTPSGGGIDFRPATAADLTAVLDLWARAAAGPTATDDPAGLYACLALDPEALILAVEDGRIVGAIIAAWNGWRGMLYRLAVDPAHRRQGIGRALVLRGQRRLEDLGVRRMAAEIHHDNAASLALFRAAGWRVDPHLVRVSRSAGDPPP